MQNRPPAARRSRAAHMWRVSVCFRTRAGTPEFRSPCRSSTPPARPRCRRGPDDSPDRACAGASCLIAAPENVDPEEIKSSIDKWHVVAAVAAPDVQAHVVIRAVPMQPQPQCRGQNGTGLFAGVPSVPVLVVPPSSRPSNLCIPWSISRSAATNTRRQRLFALLPPEKRRARKTRALPKKTVRAGQNLTPDQLKVTISSATLLTVKSSPPFVQELANAAVTVCDVEGRRLHDPCDHDRHRESGRRRRGRSERERRRRPRRR